MISKDFVQTLVDTPHIFSYSVAGAFLHHIHSMPVVGHLGYFGDETKLSDDDKHNERVKWLTRKQLTDGFVAMDTDFAAKVWESGVRLTGENWDWRDEKLLRYAVREALLNG